MNSCGQEEVLGWRGRGELRKGRGRRPDRSCVLTFLDFFKFFLYRAKTREQGAEVRTKEEAAFLSSFFLSFPNTSSPSRHTALHGN